MNFSTWWSIISTIIGIILTWFSIWQYLAWKSQERKTNAQIKIWMQEANGISIWLTRIVQDNLSGRYSSTNDIANSIWALQSSASSLYQSLYEERCVDEEEYKSRQKKISGVLEKQQLDQLQSSQPIVN